VIGPLGPSTASARAVLASSRGAAHVLPMARTPLVSNILIPRVPFIQMAVTWYGCFLAPKMVMNYDLREPPFAYGLGLSRDARSSIRNA